MTRRPAEVLYQLEAKLSLVKFFFHPANGWSVNVHIDPMERAKGGAHARDKTERARKAEEALRRLGVIIGRHSLFGRVDVVADHPKNGLRLVEVEGDSSRQREQAMYLALGQIILSMKLPVRHVRYGLAVPRSPEWLDQLRKIPPEVSKKLALDLYAVSANDAERIEGGTPMPRYSR